MAGYEDSHLYEILYVQGKKSELYVIHSGGKEQALYKQYLQIIPKCAG